MARIFWVHQREAPTGSSCTRFGRAVYALTIDILCANYSPTAGRVEDDRRAAGLLPGRCWRGSLHPNAIYDWTLEGE